MVQMYLSVTGPASADTVWQRYLQPALWVQWAPHLTRVISSTPMIAPGTEGRVTALRLLTLHFRVVSVDATNRSWSWDVWRGPLTMGLVHDVTAIGSGARAGLLLKGPWWVVIPYIPIARCALAGLVKRSNTTPAP